MAQQPTVVRKVAEFFRREALPADNLVVAVSGGPDSVALLRALAQLVECRQVTTGRFVVAHFNHRLRGPESDADEAFVQGLCEDPRFCVGLSLEFCVARADVAAEAAAERANLEGTARRLRYEWLAQVALERQMHFVVTGHTADDQAETVLHRLLRGAGLRGLRGIPVRRPLVPPIQVVRPLLQVTRAELLPFLQELDQPFRTDRSNTDGRFLRNRIRHELLPYLAAEFNPRIRTMLCGLAQEAEDAWRQQQATAARLLAAAELPRAGPVLVFDQRQLAEATRRELRALFRLAWEREGWPQAGMGRVEWERLASVALGQEPATDLPGHIRVRNQGRVVLLEPNP